MMSEEKKRRTEAEIREENERIWAEWIADEQRIYWRVFGGLDEWEASGDKCVNCGTRLNNQYGYIIADGVWICKECGAENIGKRKKAALEKEKKDNIVSFRK